MKSFPPEDMPNSVSSQHHYEQCLPFDFNNFMKQPELPLRVEIVFLVMYFFAEKSAVINLGKTGTRLLAPCPAEQFGKLLLSD